MKDLSLRDLLRYGVAGGVFLLTVGAIEGSAVLNKVRIDSLGGATALLGVALVLGALIYSLHRALLFPFVLRAQLNYSRPARDLLGCAVPICTIVSEPEMQFDQLRWAEPDAMGKNFSEWGDQMHLLYTSGEAIAFGLLSELIASNKLTLKFDAAPNVVAVALLVCSAILMVAGAISQRRLLATTCRSLSQKTACRDPRAA